jgi:enamine deaminase RidA (YjgF/YER057c/UK114 family)
MERTVLGKTSSSYSLGIVAPAGRLVFISGTVALDEAGKVMAPGDMEGQTRAIFGQIEQLLREAGATLQNVVKLTAYVTDMSQYGQYAKVRREVFAGGVFPASAAVKVAGLIEDGLVVEVEAVAVI